MRASDGARFIIYYPGCSAEVQITTTKQERKNKRARLRRKVFSSIINVLHTYLGNRCAGTLFLFFKVGVPHNSKGPWAHMIRRACPSSSSSAFVLLCVVVAGIINDDD